VLISGKKIITLWYRPPELLLGWTRYTPAVDLWSVGCIMYELCTRRVLFPGDGELDQLARILRVIGMPSEATWPGVTQAPGWAALNVSAFPTESTLAAKARPQCDDDVAAINLVSRLLDPNPNTRITASHALAHTFFDEIRARPPPPTVSPADDGEPPPSSVAAVVTTGASTMTTSAQRLLIPGRCKRGASSPPDTLTTDGQRPSNKRARPATAVPAVPAGAPVAHPTVSTVFTINGGKRSAPANTHVSA